jgi:hypothetical protein
MLGITVWLNTDCGMSYNCCLWSRAPRIISFKRRFLVCPARYVEGWRGRSLYELAAHSDERTV